MKIDHLRITHHRDRPRVAADIVWEDCDRSPQTLYFETDPEFADDLTCNPHAFLVGMLMPAMHFGEKRIRLDHDICPELYEGLINALHWMRRWFYDPMRALPVIETRTAPSIAYAQKDQRAAFFFSGGVDAFSSFYGNKLRFPADHPYRIKDGLLVYGLEIYDPAAFSHVHASLKKASEELGLVLIPVYTNLYLEFREEDRENHFSFWINELMGATFAAIAHAFARRLTVVSIASNADIAHLDPWGSHPLLDANYSSSDLKIRHDGAYRSRFEKTKLIAGEDVALKNLRVCNLIKKYTSDSQNCGLCAKCVKTKLTLSALGALDKTKAFDNMKLDPEMVIRGAYIYDAYTEATYSDLVEPLFAQGQDRLARAVQLCLDRYRDGNSHFRSRLHRLDRRFFNGTCGRVIRGLRGKRLASR